MASATINDAAPAQSPALSESGKLDNASTTSIAPSSEPVDFPHYKDLQRSLRNAMKKLNATAKVDAIIAENPGKSLDELVAAKKINLDQKAQALKKPTLQANVAQLEEQITRYKEFAAYYEQRLVSQKAELEKAHKEEVESLREKVAGEATEAGKNDFDQRLLSLSKFLCAAASIRHSGDETSPEARAFEAVLFQVYAGTADAVASMVKLIDGADERVVSLVGETLEITYAKVKHLSEGKAPTTEVAPEAAPASDPTAANAAYTELQATSYAAEATATQQAAAESQPEQIAPPPQTVVSDGANAVAEAKWEADADPRASSVNTEDWVEVPRDPAETETGLQATPANIDADVRTETGAGNAKAQGGDGFEQVVHHQRQPSFRGRGRGRGRGGDGFRGRGRGDFRGRGRGRGGRGRGGANGAPPTVPAQ